MYCLLNSCLSLLSVAVIRHHDQNNLEEGLTYLFVFPCHRSSFKESRAGTQSRKLEAGIHAENIQGCCLTGLLLLACSKSLLYNPRPPLQGGTTQQWAAPISCQSKNTSHRLAYRPIWWKHCVNWGFLFLADSNVWQVDKNSNQYSNI